MQQIGVLLADALPIFRQGVRALLEREADLEILGDTGDGSEVACLAKRLSPRVIVTDADLPGSGGADLAKDIRLCCPKVEILVLTTHNNAFYVIGMLRAGVRGYILKQTPDLDLAEAIRKVNRGEPVLDPDVVSTILNDVHQLKPRLRSEGELTPREREIIELIAGGKTSREIAMMLGLSPKTVDNIRAQILQKLHARNKVEAVTTALEYGVIRISPPSHGPAPVED